MTDNSPSLSQDHQISGDEPFLSDHSELQDFIEAKKLSIRVAAIVAMYYYGSCDWELDTQGYLDFFRRLLVACHELEINATAKNFKLFIDTEDRSSDLLRIAVQYVGPGWIVVNDLLRERL